MNRIRKTWLLRLGGIGLSLLATGCSITTHQSTLDPKGPVAKMQLELFMVTVWITLFIFLVVGGSLLWTVIKYRERPSDRDKPIPEQGHGNPLIETALIVASILLLVIIAIPTVKAIWYTGDLPEDPSSELGNWYPGKLETDNKDEFLIINATGYQWWWAFEYPQFGLTTSNEFAIPVGKTVKINLRAGDVIHSFWLPKIAGKVDLIPGRANWMWIQADTEGHYYGQCAEYCGEAHAYMLFRTEALSPKNFANWIEHQKKDAPEPTDPILLEGKKLFLSKTCVQCHMIREFTAGTGGPDLTHIASRKSVAAGILDNQDLNGNIDTQKQYQNLFNWIKESYKYKPGNLMYYPDNGLKNVKLSDAEVHKLVLYLQTLK